MDEFVINLLLDIDNYVRELVSEYGTAKVKKFGMGGVAKGFYLGMEPEYGVDEYELFEAMDDITPEEMDYWEKLFYQKTSWLNNGSAEEVKP